MEVQTVHPHVTEEEAFLALAETAGNVDLAIGKLSNLSFFRDVRAVSNLHKESEAGAVIQATSTALERTLDSGKERQDVVYKKFKLFVKNKRTQMIQQVQNVYRHLVQEKEASWMKIFFPSIKKANLVLMDII